MDQLQRFIDLVNKTGDKLVIFDRYQPDNSFVILGINDYEKLVTKPNALRDLTEEELADKINGDIAIWKNEQLLSDSEEDTDWPEEIEDWSSLSEEEVNDLLDDDLDLEEEQEEELNYLYPEPEIVSPPQIEAIPETIYPESSILSEIEGESEPFSEAPLEKEAEEETASVEEEALEPSPSAKKNDFQSLGDILESKYERGNNWTIPSDRKRLASDDASRYETIGF